MSLWQWLSRFRLLDAPPLPELGADADAIVALAAESREAAERVEVAAREWARRTRALEDRLRLYERRGPDAPPDHSGEPTKPTGHVAGHPGKASA